MKSNGKEVFGYSLTIKTKDGEVRLTSTFYGETLKDTINEILSNADTYHAETAPHYVAEFLVFDHNTETSQTLVGGRQRDVLVAVFGKDASLRCESTLLKNKSYRWLVRVGSEVKMVDVTELK